MFKIEISIKFIIFGQERILNRVGTYYLYKYLLGHMSGRWTEDQ